MVKFGLLLISNGIGGDDISSADASSCSVVFQGVTPTQRCITEF